jgi:hypothetical protein
MLRGAFRSHDARKACACAKPARTSAAVGDGVDASQTAIDGSRDCTIVATVVDATEANRIGRGRPSSCRTARGSVHARCFSRLDGTWPKFGAAVNPSAF